MARVGKFAYASGGWWVKRTLSASAVPRRPAPTVRALVRTTDQKATCPMRTR
jgi:hypothetical protein